MKKALRQGVLDARFRLTPEERRAKSREIEKRLFGLPEFQASRTVLFYASFRSEVETHDMVRRALAEGKRVVLPKVKGDHLLLFEVADFDRDVKPGKWDIPEPAGGKQVQPEEIQFIVVPGAAFDLQGNRLGYGAGFYDKLLKAYPGSTAALAFELQILPDIPVDVHDVPMQRVVTEKRIIEIKS
ncbi:MAG: 5-formyltetrahydrofolate cyclo-ligase [Nitrospirae bacterium GWD2_57_9]|nr:MAG: 5-formyltetrahydrofolate cyclo-ligase [Nitrospirae bacterium GWD2_57_9]